MTQSETQKYLRDYALNHLKYDHAKIYNARGIITDTVALTIDALSEYFLNEEKENDGIFLKGLGRLKSIIRKPRTFRDKKTMKLVKTPEKNTVVIRVFPSFKEKLNKK